MKKLLVVLFLCIIPFSPHAQTDSEIAKLLIRDSISQHSGRCPCPYSSASNGSLCGARSVYGRPGGTSPLCYESDVSQAQITAWRARHQVAQKQEQPTGSKARTLSTGAASGLYDRKDWEHWVDEDGDCQNSRAELLIKTSSEPVTFTAETRCIVMRGAWFDVYSGETITLAREIDIDHLVPLSWANGRGGYVWSKDRKRLFANDESNLIPTSKSLNRSKGAKGPDEWMPPRQSFRCEYVTRFDQVVTNYDLMYTPGEKRIIDRMLAACAHQ